MEVVNENFYKLLPEIEQAIDDSTFIAIDGEFTGLHDDIMLSAYDTTDQYYQKLRRNCKDFLMVQVGLCIVKYDTKKQKFTYRAYNLYTFPKQMSRNGQNYPFLSHSSSMEFLSKHNFDFNKLFKHGIPFLTAPDEQVMRNELLNRYKKSCLPVKKPSKATNIHIPDYYKTHVENACEKVRLLLENAINSEVIIADGINDFLKQLIHQEVYQKYSDTVFLKSKIVEGVGIMITAQKGLPIEVVAKNRMKREEMELEKGIGISAIFKKIRNSNKPVVGHNMSLDVCHMIHQFCIPLPSVFSEFQDSVKMISPKFLDTKYISGIKPLRKFFKSTVLDDLNKTLAGKYFSPFTVLEPELPSVGYSIHSKKLHNAGYDSYLTSSVFVNLCNLYARVEDIKEQILPNSPCLNQYMNKFFMYRLIEDSCLNLNGPEPKLQRNHVYHMTFPSEWKNKTINKIFKPFKLLHTKFINDSSAWVALKDASQVNEFNAILPKLQASHKNMVLLPWSVYYNIDNNTTTTKRKIEHSPPKDNLDSLSRDQNALGETLEKVPCISKGRTVTGENISPIFEGAAESIEIDE